MWKEDKYIETAAASDLTVSVALAGFESGIGLRCWAGADESDEGSEDGGSELHVCECVNCSGVRKLSG